MDRAKTLERVSMDTIFHLRGKLHCLLHARTDFDKEESLLLGENRVVQISPRGIRSAGVVLCHFASKNETHYGRYVSHRSCSPILDSVTREGAYVAIDALSEQEALQETSLLRGFIRALQPTVDFVDALQTTVAPHQHHAIAKPLLFEQSQVLA